MEGGIIRLDSKLNLTSDICMWYSDMEIYWPRPWKHGTAKHSSCPDRPKDRGRHFLTRTPKHKERGDIKRRKWKGSHQHENMAFLCFKYNSAKKKKTSLQSTTESTRTTVKTVRTPTTTKRHQQRKRQQHPYRIFYNRSHTPKYENNQNTHPQKKNNKHNSHQNKQPNNQQTWLGTTSIFLIITPSSQWKNTTQSAPLTPRHAPPKSPSADDTGGRRVCCIEKNNEKIASIFWKKQKNVCNKKK